MCAVSLSFFAVTRETSPVVINAGVAALDDDSAAREILRRLRESDWENVVFTPFAADELDKMENMVKYRKLECAYIISGGLSEKIRNGDTDGAITLVRTKASAAAPFINEAVYSAFIKAAAPGIAAKTASERAGGDYGEILREFDAKIDNYQKQGIFMQPKFLRVNAEGAPGDLAGARLFHALLLCFIFEFSYLVVPMPVGDPARGMRKILGARAVCVYYAGLLAAVCAALALLAGFGFLSAAGACGEGLAAFLLPAGREACAILLYITCAAALSVFFSIVLKSAEIIYSWFIFAFAFQIFFGGIFIDLGEISGTLGACQVLPSRFYMDALMLGERRALAVTAVLAVLACFTAAGLSARTRREQI
jgi:hypothetical protein